MFDEDLCFCSEFYQCSYCREKEARAKQTLAREEQKRATREEARARSSAEAYEALGEVVAEHPVAAMVGVLAAIGIGAAAASSQRRESAPPRYARTARTLKRK